MRDLAPDIVRQRLLVEGYFSIDVDPNVIREFFSSLTNALELRVYGEPSIYAPGGEGRDENQGYDAFIPLIDSGISLYIWTAKKFLSVLIYTCKNFDDQVAIETVREFFGMQELVSESI